MPGFFYSATDDVVLLMSDDKGRTGIEVERHTATTAFLVPFRTTNRLQLCCSSQCKFISNDCRLAVLITVCVCQLKSVNGLYRYGDAIFRNT